MTRSFLPSLLALCTFAGASAALLGTNLTTNGDFELGDTSSWQTFPTPTSTFAITNDANSGNWAGRVFNDFAASSHVIKQANLGAGFVTPGSTINISFAAKGAGAAGGVAFAELFSEISGGGVSSSVILGGAPLGLTPAWQTFNFSATAGSDVSGGITLQFAAVTGEAMGSSIELLVDDVVVTAIPNVVTLQPYSEDFEGLDMMSPSALADAGWVIFANVFDPNGGYLYGYGVFPAPNGGPGFSAIASGQGGTTQGNQQIVTYSDYNNGDHGNGFNIETNVFQEQVVGAGDVGKTFKFQFDAKRGDLLPNSLGTAFIKIIDGTVFTLDGLATLDTTNLPTTWGTFSLSITIQPNHVGDFFQIGFQTNATLFVPSGMVYDNLVFGEDTLGTVYCGPAVANSAGQPGLLSATGSAVVAANDVTLEASQLPTSQFGYFLNSLTQGFTANPGGSQGNLCLGGSIGRYSAVPFNSGSTGSASLALDLAITPTPGGATSVAAGQTWNFTCWYRDVNPAATSNFTNGLSILFM